MDRYGLLTRLVTEGGAFESDYIYMYRHDGQLLTKKPLHFDHWLGYNQ
jgi:hypothetical protein